MPGKYESEWITDADISAAIRYLDPDLNRKTKHERDGLVLAICVTAMALVFCCLEFCSFYWSIF